MQAKASLGAKGSIRAKVIRAPKAPLSWRIKNTLTAIYLWGWFVNWLAVKFHKLTGVPVIISQLAARHIKADGQVIDYGVICRRLITTDATEFLVDDWHNDATDITNMNYHASGTGTTAAANTDTALETEATTVTDRIAGTKSQAVANALETVGTQAFTGSAAITEHGLLSVITEGSGVLWDRHTFTAINVANGDSIQWTYTCTISPET